ncbi:ferritin-like domain-containing protein [Streptococcus ratti]|uniref:Bacterioferritin (Cytochrome b1) n=2 Tax=Streptococcus ratti TaxID=1341 RepID=A0A7X9QGS5_STRRT|nr:ferritin-like domain-containing protein [Streptococcus ratti]VEI59342.1 bacterioferritin [Streptococcus mutans]EJN94992.1 bacterioferritin (cytochrome b1) [Streptococcus ratti FA-1 = DSM 20564]EMP69564.1 bacterioferritin [Streptococcus ratti FA-1 = DSM 20564]NMD49793.1 bacterioferritin (cytochrome b1) [Streptococcus ratti]QEY06921.1 bacterioferritin (cytochrome b1) [Streptococcus ratti]
MTKEAVSYLQKLVTTMNTQATYHQMQARIFGALGFSKLETKYDGHAEEERDFMNQFINRILDLGGELKMEVGQSEPLFQNPIDYLKHDLDLSREGFAFLKANNLFEDFKTDYATYDLLKAYYKDEEEDMLWTEAQLDLIELIGVQNWLTQQL